MTAPRQIRWGVLGWARIARLSLIPALLRSAHARFAALASRDEAKLAEARQLYPGLRTHLGYEALLADPEVDAVYIPLPIPSTASGSSAPPLPASTSSARSPSASPRPSAAT